MLYLRRYMGVNPLAIMVMTVVTHFCFHNHFIARALQDVFGNMELEGFGMSFVCFY